jgi:predicted DNA-binding WGR domain protein
MTAEKVTLYFKQGTSDKVYKASMEAAEGNLCLVNFAYGRRGSTLKTGTKTTTPVDYAAAKKIYDKLSKAKPRKVISPAKKVHNMFTLTRIPEIRVSNVNYSTLLKKRLCFSLSRIRTGGHRKSMMGEECLFIKPIQ